MTNSSLVQAGNDFGQRLPQPDVPRFERHPRMPVCYKFQWLDFEIRLHCPQARLRTGETAGNKCDEIRFAQKIEKHREGRHGSSDPAPQPYPFKYRIHRAAE